MIDLGLEYETETTANVIDLQGCGSGEENVGDWNIDDFEQAIGSEFNTLTQEAPDFSDELFCSDGEELF
jgi:hypothetical protein